MDELQTVPPAVMEVAAPALSSVPLLTLGIVVLVLALALTVSIVAFRRR